MNPLLLVFCALLTASGPALQDNPLVGLESYLDRLGEGGCSGHVLVARGEKVLFARGIGLADREEKRPWTPATLTPVGSITKQFTGAAVMKLAEAGKLSVEDSLADHLQDVPPDKTGITLQQLLTHTSGLWDISRELPDKEWIDRDDMLATVLEHPLQDEPGKRYEYSNTGFSFLAAIVEKRSGRPYDRFVREELLRPAGMPDSGYLQKDFDRARLAVGYDEGRRWGTLPDDVYTAEGPSWVLLGNGGIISSAEQMQRWALALLDGKILSKESIELMWTPLVDESNGAGASHYGFGWSIVEIGGRRVVTHNGGNGIFFADFAIVPQERLIVFLSTNALRECRAVNNLLVEILQHLLEGAPFPAR